MRKSKPYSKVPLVVAINMMNHIYTPIMRFYREMAKNQTFNYCSMCKTYVLKSFNACMAKNREFFILNDWTYTLDKVSDDVVGIVDKYFKKFGDSLWYALAKLFDCIRNDLNKESVKQL